MAGYEKSTVSVAALRERANHFMAQTDDSVAHEYRNGGPMEVALAAGAMRRAVASFLETALQEANAYKGFRYTDLDGCTLDERSRKVREDDYDDSRRHYN